MESPPLQPSQPAAEPRGGFRVWSTIFLCNIFSSALVGSAASADRYVSKSLAAAGWGAIIAGLIAIRWRAETSFWKMAGKLYLAILVLSPLVGWFFERDLAGGALGAAMVIGLMVALSSSLLITVRGVVTGTLYWLMVGFFALAMAALADVIVSR